MSCKSVRKLLRKVANRQTNRQANKQRRKYIFLGGGKNRLLLVAEIKNSENQKTSKIVQRIKIVKNRDFSIKDNK